MFSPFVLLPLPLLFHFAAALLNVTVDDTDSSITYRPQSSWESGLKSGLDYGGSHSVSSDPNSNATFHFTGVAVYYLAPRWPNNVSTVLSLNGGKSAFVNLTDPNATPTPPGGSESAKFSVAWSATGLQNTSHSLVLTMPPASSNGGVIISDGFIYTVDNGSSAHPGSPSSTRLSSSSLGSASSHASAASHKSSNATAIGVGTALGASVFLAALLTAFCIFRRRSRADKLQSPINILDDTDTASHLPAPTPFVAQPASAHVPAMSEASVGPLGLLPDHEFSSSEGIPRPSNITTTPARREKLQPLRVQTYSPAPPAYSESEQG